MHILCRHELIEGLVLSSVLSLNNPWLLCISLVPLVEHHGIISHLFLLKHHTLVLRHHRVSILVRILIFRRESVILNGHDRKALNSVLSSISACLPICEAVELLSQPRGSTIVNLGMMCILGLVLEALGVEGLVLLH